MAAEKEIVADIRDLKNIMSMVQTYEEIAATRMQKVKTSVLSNRDFLANLYEIYRQVKYSYDDSLKRIAKKQQGTLIPRNGKTVSVFLSANTGLYGDIIRHTFELFIRNLTLRESDVVIVGKLGQLLFEGVKNTLGIKSYQYFDLSDNSSSSDDFVEIISHIVEYEHVIVYHGKFESILSQVPIEEFLTGDAVEKDMKLVEKANYIFEPSLEKIMGFFESEILASIFEQSLHESNLSKYAARMISLDRAVVNISEKLKQRKFDKQRAHHRIVNKKQLGVLSSMSLWG